MTSATTLAPASAVNTTPSLPADDYRPCSNSTALSNYLSRSMSANDIARVAVFRFGLGPRRGSPADLNQIDPATGVNRGIAACFGELGSTGHLIQVPDSLSDHNCWAAAGSDFWSSQIFHQELRLRYIKSMKQKVGFAERLVLFWSNHFSIACEKSIPVRAAIGNFERKVIRQNLWGNFSSMLQAAVAHPAMIGFLDNDNSTNLATNQNLAREILELHTLGAHPDGQAGAYTEDDVIALSKMLTGWNINYDMVLGTLNGKRQPVWGPRYGYFEFKPNDHEPATQVLLGKRYGNPPRQNGSSSTGQQQAIDALNDLAVMPATAQHLAYKLIQHFVMDDPDHRMVDSLAAGFSATGGDLRSLAEKLLLTPAAWKMPLQRIRPPHLWVVAMARALGCDDTDFQIFENPSYDKSAPASDVNRAPYNFIASSWINRLAALDNAPWGRMTPDGFPSQDSEWLDPNAIRVRVGIACWMLKDFSYRRSIDSRLWFPWRDAPLAAHLRGASYITRARGAGRLPGDFASSVAGDQLADVFLSSDFMCR